MRKYYDAMVNPWVRSSAEFLASFGKRRQEVKAMEEQMKFEQNQQNERLVAGLAGQAMGIAGNYGLQSMRGAQEAGLLAQRGQQALGLQSLAHQGQLGELEAQATLSKYGVMPGELDKIGAEYQAYQAAHPPTNESVDFGPPPNMSMDPSAQLSSEGPPATPPAPPPPGTVRDYHPQTLRALMDNEKASAYVDINETLTPEMKVAAKMRLAQERANLLPTVMREKPRPPSAQEMVQSGQIYTDQNTGVMILPKGWSAHDVPPSESDNPITYSDANGDLQSVNASVVEMPDGTVVARKGLAISRRQGGESDSKILSDLYKSLSSVNSETGATVGPDPIALSEAFGAIKQAQKIATTKQDAEKLIGSIGTESFNLKAVENQLKEFARLYPKGKLPDDVAALIVELNNGLAQHGGRP